MHIDAFYRQLDDHPPALILVHGEEPFLVEQVIRKIRQKVLDPGTVDFNDQQFAGADVSAGELLDAVRTFPVFAPYRLVTVRSFHDMPAAETDQLIPYLENPIAETILLLIAEKIDNRRKFFQVFKKNGVVIKRDPLTDRDLPDYIRNDLHRRGMQITSDALRSLCALVDTNLHELHTELDKLALFVGPQERIDVAAVEAAVARRRTDSIFAFGNAVGRGDLAQALTLIRRLCAAEEPPLLILNLVAGHFRLLWKVQSLRRQGGTPPEIARQVSRPPFVVERMLEQSRCFSHEDLVALYPLLTATDLAMKSSGADPQALLDQLAIRMITERTKKPEGRRMVS